MEQSARRGWWAVAVLFLAYLLSLMDRQILSMLVEPIRRDLGLSDTAISLLQGIAFALFYTLMGLPIAVLADRYNRKRIIAAGIVAWSFMTAACGFASNFAQLFLARIGVGIGEATLSPSAYSIIADSFPRERVARAISFYSTGGFVGPGAALLVGGWLIAEVSRFESISLSFLGTFKPWQITFVILGAAGIPFALLLATLREPKRRATPQDEGSVAAMVVQIKAHWRSYACLIGGESLIAIAGYGGLFWAPTVFIRVHEWSTRDTGVAIGLVVAVTGVVGVLSGAWLAERFQARGVHDAIPRIMALGAGLSVPFVFLLVFDSPWLALAGLSVFYLFNSMPWGVCGAGLQLTTPNRLRAKAAATMLLSTNLMGLGLGPTLMAMITDYVFADPLMVGWSLAIAGSAASALAFLLIRWGTPAFGRALAAAEAGEAAAPAAQAAQ